MFLLQHNPAIRLTRCRTDVALSRDHWQHCTTRKKDHVLMNQQTPPLIIVIKQISEVLSAEKDVSNGMGTPDM